MEVAKDMTLVATNPAAMIEAQQSLVAWCATKLQACMVERSEAEAMFNALHDAKMNVAPAKRMIRGAMRRLVFYTKIKAALEAGYYIVPPFPVQAFAVRTSKAQPKEHYGGKFQTYDEKPQVLPVGEGRYVSPVSKREHFDTEEQKNANGSVTKIARYWNTEFRDVGFPLTLVKPEIITAVGAALKRRIFDSMGVLPAYRNADPIIVGQIQHWKQTRSPVTFFVTWWLNTQDL